MKKKYITAFTLLGLLLIVIVIFKINNKQETKRKPSYATWKHQDVKNKYKSFDNLYHYKHPYLTWAHQLNEEKKYDSAIYFYKQALIKFKSEKQWDSYVWLNSYLARLYLFIVGKNYKDALPYLQEASEKGNQHLDSKHPFMGVTLYYWGLFYLEKHEADSALYMFTKALSIYSFYFEEQNIYTSDVYENIANVYYDLKFDNVKAETYYLKSVEIKEILPDSVKNHVLTHSYYRLVRYYISCNDYEKAQSYCYAAIKYVQQVKSYQRDWLEILEGVIVFIYSELQINHKSITRLKHLIYLNQQNNGDKAYLSFYLNSIGDIYSKNMEYDSAITYYKMALTATKEASLFDNQELQIADTHYSLGMTFLTLKDHKRALHFLSKCLGLRLKSYGLKHGQTAIAFQAVGNLYQETNRLDSALKYYQAGINASTTNFKGEDVHAVPLVSELNTSFYSFLIIKDKASLLKLLYYKSPLNKQFLHTSFDYYCLADSLMTLFKYRYTQENAKLAFTKNNNPIYEEIIDCATQLYQETKNITYHNLAFNFIEKTKSGLLLEALNKEEIFKQAGISLNDQRTDLYLQQELTFLQSKIEEENDNENPDESELQALHARVKAIDVKISSFQEKLKKKYPFYASIQSSTDTFTLADAKKFSFNNNSLIIEYFWGDKAVYVLTIYKNKSELLKIENRHLKVHLDSFQSKLTKGYVSTSKNEDFSSFQRNAFYIYNSIVQHALTQFLHQKGNNIPDIIIIPDGPLSYIPFEALITTTTTEKATDYRKLDYLIKNFTISYSYSARLMLKNYLQRNTNQLSRVLALSFSNEDSLKAKSGNLYELRKYNYAELPGSAREIRAISTYMRGKFYMGEEATEYIFKKEAPDFDILHVAVHGKGDSKNSYTSRLIFKQGNDSINDGSLYAYEIYSIPMKAKLAVLSACESGIGKLNTGEGMYSMARGFVYAGCPAIVMSLWQVNDNTTATLIAGFYKHLSVGSRIDASLRETKLNFIDHADSRSAHPINWAAFITLGNMTAVVEESKPAIPIIYFAFIIILGSVTFLIYKIMKRQVNSTSRFL